MFLPGWRRRRATASEHYARSGPRAEAGALESLGAMVPLRGNLPGLLRAPALTGEDQGESPSSSPGRSPPAGSLYANIYTMKRTTIYLDPDLEVLLKLEALRSGKPAAEVIREAVRAYLQGRPGKLPPGAGAFRSRRKETAERAEEILRRSKFGED